MVRTDAPPATATRAPGRARNAEGGGIAVGPFGTRRMLRLMHRGAPWCLLAALALASCGDDGPPTILEQLHESEHPLRIPYEACGLGDDQACARVERLCAGGAHPEVCRLLSEPVSVPMDVPASGPPSAPLPTVTIGIAPDGSLTLDGEPTSLAELRSMSFEPAERAVIAADRATSHASFIAVVDALRAAGITRYAINVNPADVRSETPTDEQAEAE